MGALRRAPCVGELVLTSGSLFHPDSARKRCKTLAATTRCAAESLKMNFECCSGPWAARVISNQAALGRLKRLSVEVHKPPCSAVKVDKLSDLIRLLDRVRGLVELRVFMSLSDSEVRSHRKTQTQNLGQLNPKTRLEKHIFGGHFDTYNKMIRKRRNGFLNRSQNVI